LEPLSYRHAAKKLEECYHPSRESRKRNADLVKQFPKLLRSSAPFRSSAGHEAEIKLSDAGVKPPIDSIDISFFPFKSGRISNIALTERIDQMIWRVRFCLSCNLHMAFVSGFLRRGWLLVSSVYRPIIPDPWDAPR